MRDQMKISINYLRLKKYLTEQLNYSESAAIVTIDDIRRMDLVVREAFIVWFTTGKTPQGELCGVHYNNLVTYRKMNPVAAFLAIDWYVKEPRKAYSTIAMPLKDDGNMIVDTTGKMQMVIVQLAEKAAGNSENTEDITE